MMMYRTALRNVTVDIGHSKTEIVLPGDDPRGDPCYVLVEFLKTDDTQ